MHSLELFFSTFLRVYLCEMRNPPNQVPPSYSCGQHNIFLKHKGISIFSMGKKKCSHQYAFLNKSIFIHCPCTYHFLCHGACFPWNSFFVSTLMMKVWVHIHLYTMQRTDNEVALIKMWFISMWNLLKENQTNHMIVFDSSDHFRRSASTWPT